MSVGLIDLPQKTGTPTQVLAGGDPEWMDIGVTIAWGLVDAVTETTTLANGDVVFAGEKYIRYGTVLVPVTTANVAEKQTVNLSGDDDPTGGTWELTVGDYGTLEDLDWDISAADLQAAIRALSDDLATTTVGLVGFVYTITFPAGLGDVTAVTADATGLTGGVGDTFAITILTTVPGERFNGMYAPFDSTKSDGRQTLARDYVGILNKTIKDREATVLGANLQNDLMGLLIGGTVWESRLLVGGSGQPTLSALKAVMPRLKRAHE